MSFSAANTSGSYGDNNTFSAALKIRFRISNSVEVNCSVVLDKTFFAQFITSIFLFSSMISIIRSSISLRLWFKPGEFTQFPVKFFYLIIPFSVLKSKRKKVLVTLYLKSTLNLRVLFRIHVSICFARLFSLPEVQQSVLRLRQVLYSPCYILHPESIP